MRPNELMHLHESAKGRGGKISAARQPCKIGEDNRSIRRLCERPFHVIAIAAARLL
jgi:hypothetical protein